MKTKFFNLYFRLTYNKVYYEAYLESSKRKNKIVVSVLALASCGGIGGLCVSDSSKFWWGVFLVCVQIAQAFSPLFNYSERISALQYVVQDYRKICRSMYSDWLDMSDKPEDELDGENIRMLMRKYSGLSDATEERFVDAIYLPTSGRMAKKAEQVAKAEFQFCYDVSFERCDVDEQIIQS